MEPRLELPHMDITRDEGCRGILAIAEPIANLHTSFFLPVLNAALKLRGQLRKARGANSTRRNWLIIDLDGTLSPTSIPWPRLTE